MLAAEMSRTSLNGRVEMTVALAKASFDAEVSWVQTGTASNTPSLNVSWVTPLPSAFMTKMSSSPPSRVLWNAMRWPSGDQPGSSSTKSPEVSWVTPLPSAFMTKTGSRPPSRSLENTMRAPPGDQPARSPPSLLLAKAIRVPSGDHAPGNPPSVVSWVSPVPTTLMTNTSERPLWKFAYAIRLPSGDQIGSTLPPVSLVTRATPDPSGFIT